MNLQISNKYDMILDVSGSVGGSDNYFTTSKQIYLLYAADVRNYYFWDDVIQIVTKQQFQQFINARQGRGGNQLTLIANEIILKNIKNIILITDGEVGDYDVQNTDKIMSDYHLKKSICYIVSNTYCNQVNMSVTCPFTRNCENKIFKKQNNTPMQMVASFTPQDFKILAQLDIISLQNFQAQYQKIQGLIIALNMGKDGNIPLKNNLLLMKHRLIRELAQKNNEKNLSQTIRQYLQKNDFVNAINKMNQVSSAYFKDCMTTELERRITHLIGLCGDLRGKYSIKEIKSNKIRTAKVAEKGDVDLTIQISNLTQNLIQCPILMDQDVPQILVDQCEPILLGVEKNIVDDIAACPLRLLNYPEVRAKLKSKLSNYVGVMGIKANFDKNLLKNPFTQAKLLGSIPLGTHHSHVKVGNHTIAKLITGGKILGNLNMYYAVIWYLIHQGQIEYLKDIQKNVTEHLTFRLKNSTTYASMCGQSQFVTTQINTDIAIWFCVNSGFMNQPTDRDTFRYHLYNIEPMIKIVEVLGYPNDKGLIPHYNRTKSLNSIFTLFKGIDEKKAFKTMISGIYQNGLYVKKQFIQLDGPASVEQVKFIRNLLHETYKFKGQLTNEQLFYFASQVDSDKNFSTFVLDYNFIAPNLPSPKITWKYTLQTHQISLKICQKTLRPYFLNNKLEKIEVSEEQKSQKANFELFKYFESYIMKQKKLPTTNELILYINKKLEDKKYETLPYLTEKWIKNFINQNMPIYEKIHIEQIIRTLNKSRNIDNRIKMESES